MSELTTTCAMCAIITRTTAGENPFLVRELETGYVLIGWHQYFRGYTLFLSKQHKKELHELEPEFKKKFLEEMSVVAEAICRGFEPKKLNYELLGNTEEHLHWHLFPRYGNDPNPKQPIWKIDESVRRAESTKPNEVELKELKEILNKQLDKLL